MRYDQACIYCGRIATTRDHVPPKSFYPKPFPDNLLTVPACGPCNASFSDDEEYAKVILSSVFEEDSYENVALKVWNERTTRTLEKKLNLLKEIYGNMEPIDGERIKIKFDRKRIDRIVEKIVRGLFYHHYRIALKPDTRFFIELFPGTLEPEIDPEIGAFLLGQPFEIIGSGVVRYRQGISNGNPFASVWIMSFMGSNRNTFLITTTPVAKA